MPAEIRKTAMGKERCNSVLLPCLIGTSLQISNDFVGIFLFCV